MSSAGGSARLAGLVSIVLALMLTVVPLPDSAGPFRPDWVALILIYWTMMRPRTWCVGSAWVAGVLLDVLQGTILGQHALALCFVVFVTARFHLLMRVFPVQQMTITLFALLALYQFLLFWTNGVAGVDVALINYWAPVVTGTLLWPVVSLLLSGVPLRSPGRR